MTALSRGELLALTAVLSFCSLVYEMTIAACFVAFTGDAPLWQSLTLGLYLAAVGLGTWSCSRRPASDAFSALWRVELALAVAGAASAAGVFSVETVFRVRQHFFLGGQPPGALSAVLAVVVGHSFTALVGWLSGFELPLLLRLHREAEPARGGGEREVLGLNYLGGLAGGLAFSFWLLPAFDASGAAAAASGLNLAACAFLYKRRAGTAAGPRGRAALAAAGAAWAALLVLSPLAARLNLVAFYADRLGAPGAVAPEQCCAKASPGSADILAALWERRENVERVPSRVQRIDLVNQHHERSPIGDHFNRRPEIEQGLPYGLALFHDRRYQFYGGNEAVYHEFLAHVPVQLFSRVPEEAAILGGGDGLLAKELLKYGDKVRSIVNVELDPAMVELARSEPRLRRLNSGSFRDPKVELIVDDAFGWVRDTRRRFDAVFIDFPFPYNYDAAKLFTVEFYRNVAALLKPGGFVALDYPLVSQEALDEEADPEGLRRNSIAVNTLQAAGFRTIVPYGTESTELLERGDAMLLQGPPEDPEGDEELGRLSRRLFARRYLLRHPGVTADLKEDLVPVRNRLTQETMLAFTVDRSEPDFQFKDYGPALYTLNPLRLKLLEGGRYPYDQDKSLVNSVVRPTLFRSLQFIERD